MYYHAASCGGIYILGHVQYTPIAYAILSVCNLHPQTKLILSSRNNIRPQVLKQILCTLETFTSLMIVLQFKFFWEGEGLVGSDGIFGMYFYQYFCMPLSIGTTFIFTACSSLWTIVYDYNWYKSLGSAFEFKILNYHYFMVRYKMCISFPSSFPCNRINFPPYPNTLCVYFIGLFIKLMHCPVNLQTFTEDIMVMVKCSLKFGFDSIFCPIFFVICSV